VTKAPVHPGAFGADMTPRKMFRYTSCYPYCRYTQYIVNFNAEYVEKRKTLVNIH